VLGCAAAKLAQEKLHAQTKAFNSRVATTHYPALGIWAEFWLGLLASKNWAPSR